MATGIATSLLVFMYVTHEYSYDNFHPRANNIYQVNYEMTYGGNVENFYGTSSGFAPVMSESIPELRESLRTKTFSARPFSTEDNKVFEIESLLFADTNFFDFFDFKLKIGNKETAFQRPNTALLTPKTAQTIFGEKNPIGQVIYYREKYPFEIIGIIEEAPTNSRFHYDFVAPLSSFYHMGEGEKIRISDEFARRGAFSSFFHIPEIKDMEALCNSITAIDTIHEFKPYSDISFNLVPLTTAHLYKQENIKAYLFAFLCTGIVILLLAIMNYTNLVTAQSTLRDKETGIRKVVGAKRSTILIQFLFESAVINTISFVTGLTLLTLSLSGIISILQLPFDASYLFNSNFIWVIGLLFTVCILLGSIYPAVLLSNFNAINIIKSGRGKNTVGASVRQFMTFFQFAASIILICFSLVIHYQINFMQQKNTGLEKDHLLGLYLPREIGQHYPTFKAKIQSLGNVVSVGTSSSPIYTGSTGGELHSKSYITKSDVLLNYINVDTDFFKTMNIQWQIPPTLTYQNYDIVLNESAKNKLEVPDSLLNQSLNIFGKKRVAGITKNFNFQSLEHAIAPLLINVLQDTSAELVRSRPSMLIKFHPKANIKELISKIEDEYESVLDGYPLDYYFLDEAYNNLYKKEIRLAFLFNMFTTIAIVIAALGLLGLATFAVNRRAKEISIRKIVGASIVNIFLLLSKDYTKIILLAFVVAIPVANYFISEWLNEFAYKIELKWWHYTLPAIIIFSIAFITVGGRIIKAAIVNPAETLRDE